MGKEPWSQKAAAAARASGGFPCQPDKLAKQALSISQSFLAQHSQNEQSRALGFSAVVAILPFNFPNMPMNLVLEQQRAH